MLINQFQPCSRFIALENTRKPLDFWYFQGVNGNIGQEWVKYRMKHKVLFDIVASTIKW